MFGRIGRHLHTTLSHIPFKGKAGAGFAALTSFGAWYLLQQYHPSRHQYDVASTGDLLKRATQAYLKGITKEALESGKIQDVDIDYEHIRYAVNKHRWGLSDSIDEFDFTDEAQRLELAKEVYKRLPWILVENIDKFHITDEAQRLELAKEVCKRLPWILVENIDKFHITDEAQRLELAKEVCKEDPRALARNIDKFHITDEAQRLELAKEVCKESPSALTENIDKFHITDEAKRLELAKEVCKESPSALTENIDKFHITDEAKRLELAKEVCEQRPWFLAENIDKFHITDGAQRLELAKEVCKRLPWNLVENIDKFDLTDPFAVVKITIAILAGLLFTNNKVDSVYAMLRKVFPKEIEEASSKQEVLQFCLKQRKYPIFIDEGYEPLWDAIFAYRGRAMVSFLLQEVILYGKEKDFQNAYKELSQRSKTLLPAIIPSTWISSKEQIEAWKGFMEEYERAFSVAKSPLFIAFLTAAKGIDEVSAFSAEQKLSVLGKVCLSSKDPDAILKGLRLITYFIGVEQENKLLSFSEESAVPEMEMEFLENLSKLFPHVSIPKEELIDRYLETFGMLRIPYGLETYCHIHKNSERRVKEAIERFASSVLLGTFEEERYRTDNNSHLASIEKKDPVVLESWKHLSFEKTIEAQKVDVYESFSFKEFLQQKLQDGHFTEKELPLLSVEARDPVMQEIQKACALLLGEKLPKEEFLSKLRDLAQLVEKKYPKLEVVNDLKRLSESLQTAVDKPLKKVVFTTKWYDLFLAGSEVGSCQRLDGSANLNQCLMAYCLDGKNGMLAVQGPDGKTEARAILRLLTDKDGNPALFLDRMYPVPCPEDLEKEIISAATECAKSLGVKVYQQSGGEGAVLESKQGPVPYEYADGAEGVMKDGVFRVVGKELYGAG